MKAFMHYVILVGIPVLTVLVFIRIGENSLTAPASIGGIWKMEPVSEEGSAECANFHFRDEESILNISQSGRYLVLTFNDEKQTTFSGKLTGLTIAAETPATQENPHSTLNMTIDRQAEPDSLEGTVQIASCEEALSFNAIREPQLPSTTGGH